MSTRELDAAGIHDPRLRVAYETCRQLNASHGKSYYLATLLLEPAKRPHVHALYGFARYADEIVDNGDPATMTETLAAFSDRFGKDLAEGSSEDPVIAAVLHTKAQFDIPTPYFAAFLDSMAMDLRITRYRTFADLQRYMYGSAAVIGLEMLPVLGYLHDEAIPCARALGEAFQLSNFIRDVAEDHARGRVYLPEEDLAAHGVTREDLGRPRASRGVKELVRFEVARTRRIYAAADPGIGLLAPTSRDCIRAAVVLYSGILDQAEKVDFDVLHARVVVPRRRRVAVAVPGVARAVRARRAERRWHDLA